MSEEWSPNPADLNQAVMLLQALRDPTRPDHTAALHSLEANASIPAFILHVMHVFAHGMNYQISVDLRQLSGLIIKNYVFPRLSSLDPGVQQILRTELLAVLADPMQDLRKTAAILIAKIAESFSIDTWVHMLMYIVQLLDLRVCEANPTLFDGALYAIKRICEDSSVKMSQEDSARPLDSLVPRLLALLQSAHPTVRLHALESYNCLLYLLEGPNSLPVAGGLRSRNSSFDSNGDKAAPSAQAGAHHPLVVHMHAFIAQLAALGHDRHGDLRRQICISITTVTCLHVALLEPYMSSIVEYMVTMMLDAEEAVAMEACEFFMALLVDGNTRPLVAGHLHAVIANVIQRLYLTPEQMEAERIEEEEESTGARQVNIQPIHHRSSGHASEGDDYAEQSELSQKWTLRKQAALLLDNIAVSFDNSVVLPIALPIIQHSFQHENVLIREAGMLALGALCSGCLDTMTAYLPQLFPFLLQNLLHPLPEMRSISCWVLSKYSPLFSNIVDEHASPGSLGFSMRDGCDFYVQSLYAIMNTMFDPTPKVQVAACSALCLYIESSFAVRVDPVTRLLLAPGQAGGVEENVLEAHLHLIMLYVHSAFLVYGNKAKLILIDTIGTLADTLQHAFQHVSPTTNSLAFTQRLQAAHQMQVHPRVAELVAAVYAPESAGPGAVATAAAGGLVNPLRSPDGYVFIYFPKIFQEFASMDDADPRLFPLLECFTSLVSLIARDITPFLPFLVARCVRLLMLSLLPCELYAQIVRQLDLDLQQHGLARATVPPSGVWVEFGAPFLAGVLGAVPQYEDCLQRDYTICALDVLSSLVDCLQHQAWLYVFPAVTIIVNLLLECTRDSIPEVRQSAFSLAGELAKHCLPVLLLYAPDLRSCAPAVYGSPDSYRYLPAFVEQQLAARSSPFAFAHFPVLARLMDEATAHLDVAHPLVCNNAAWTIGELLMAMDAFLKQLPVGVAAGGAQVEAFLKSRVTRVMHQLIAALQSAELADNLKVNIAVTIGRCGVICPFEVAELADDFFADWCSVLSFPCPGLERYQAFSGLLAALHQHPDLLLDNKTNLYSMCVACVAYSPCPPDHVRAVHDVLAACQAHNAALWDRVIRMFAQTYSVDALYGSFGLQ